MTLRYSFRRWLLAGLTMFIGLSEVRAQARPAAKTKVKPVFTTLYIVRHAEKDSTSDRAAPTLSPLGQIRAQALSQTMARRRPVALLPPPSAPAPPWPLPSPRA